MAGDSERIDIPILRSDSCGADDASRRREDNADDDRSEGYVGNLTNAAVPGGLVALMEVDDASCAHDDEEGQNEASCKSGLGERNARFGGSHHRIQGITPARRRHRVRPIHTGRG